MRGSRERRCLANATWSGQQPVCYSKLSNLIWPIVCPGVLGSKSDREVKKKLYVKMNESIHF